MYSFQHSFLRGKEVSLALFLLLLLTVSFGAFAQTPPGPPTGPCSLSATPEISITRYRGFQQHPTSAPTGGTYLVTNVTYVFELAGVDAEQLSMDGAKFKWTIPGAHIEPDVAQPWKAKVWFTESTPLAGTKLDVTFFPNCAFTVVLPDPSVSNPTIWFGVTDRCVNHNGNFTHVAGSSNGALEDIGSQYYVPLNNSKNLLIKSPIEISAGNIVEIEDLHVLIDNEGGFMPYLLNGNTPGGEADVDAITIRVGNGSVLSIKNSVLRAGCQAMWGGIILEEGATLILENVDINDAHVAIFQEGPSTIVVNPVTTPPLGGEFHVLENLDKLPSVRISNCMVGMDLVGLVDNPALSYSTSINNIRIHSTKYGFHEPFAIQANTARYPNNGDLVENGLTLYYKEPWFLTQTGIKMNRPNGTIHSVNAPALVPTANYVYIDNVMVGIDQGYTMVNYNEAALTRCHKAGIYQHSLGNPMYHNHLEVYNSPIHVLREDGLSTDEFETWQQARTTMDWSNIGLPNTGDYYGRVRRWGYYGRGNVNAAFSGVGFKSVKDEQGLSNSTTLYNSTIGIHATGTLDVEGCTFEKLEKGILTSPDAYDVKATVQANAFDDNYYGVYTLEGWNSSLENVLTLKCNLFKAPNAASGTQQYYGLYNADPNLIMNRLTPGNTGTPLTPGGNAFPVPASVTNRAVFPKQPSSTSNCQSIDSPICGWSSLPKWTSVYNASGNLEYRRHDNEFVGLVNTSNVLVVNNNSTATNTGQPGVTTGTETCPNLGTTVYFPYLRVAADEVVSNEPKPILYPNPSNTGSFQIRDLKDQPVRIVNVLGQLQDFRQNGDLIQLVYPKAGIYQVFIGTQKATLKVE